jgi:hypothetical protein
MRSDYRPAVRLFPFFSRFPGAAGASGCHETLWAAHDPPGQRTYCHLVNPSATLAAGLITQRSQVQILPPRRKGSNSRAAEAA